MIYVFPNESQPIKQGDIFYPVPFLLINDLNKLNIVNTNEEIETLSWNELNNNGPVISITPIKPVWGIVASQDCDALRVPFLTFFVIDTLEKISKLTLPSQNKHNKWVKIITIKTRLNSGWFYLPNEDKIGFNERMAINFEEAFIVERDYLVNNISTLRKGRLNEIAYEHYREKISQYFRRYPYDEWYPLTKNEFSSYKKSSEKAGFPVRQFDWQK